MASDARAARRRATAAAANAKQALEAKGVAAGNGGDPEGQPQLEGGGLVDNGGVPEEPQLDGVVIPVEYDGPNARILPPVVSGSTRATEIVGVLEAALAQIRQGRQP